MIGQASRAGGWAAAIYVALSGLGSGRALSMTGQSVAGPDGTTIEFGSYVPGGNLAITLGNVIRVARQVDPRYWGDPASDPTLLPLMVHEYYHVLDYRLTGSPQYERSYAELQIERPTTRESSAGGDSNRT